MVDLSLNLNKMALSIAAFAMPFCILFTGAYRINQYFDHTPKEIFLLAAVLGIIFGISAYVIKSIFEGHGLENF